MLQRVQANGRTYEVDFPVKLGDKVLLPTAYWLRDVKGPTFEGTITAMDDGSYKGPCAKILGFVPPKVNN